MTLLLGEDLSLLLADNTLRGSVIPLTSGGVARGRVPVHPIGKPV
ncbi:hypothetical protein GCM10023323_43830 [Streptomyces thinghirensis]|uniref:Uncharacterized protein n=1 Tax=Streptomyces thinghirensis TaxID=551547 RepID=A0ABP9T5X0_9ACTN